MNDSRRKKTKYNVVTALILQIITILSGLVMPRLFLKAYGSEAYGAIASISQFLSYITLLEGGIGSVARAELYKPLVENDNRRISIIVNELKRFFRRVAIIFLAYAIVLASAFKSISHVEYFEWTSSFILVLVIAVSTFGQYFIGLSYSSLLQADQKIYIVNVISIITTVSNTIIVIMLINANKSIILVKAVSSCVFLLKPIIMWWYVRRRYNLGDETQRDKSVLKQKWTGMGQHIAYYVHSNTDVSVLTLLTNLKTVSVYSTYHMVSAHIQSMVSSLCAGMGAVYGKLIAANENKELERVFLHYVSLISMSCTVLFSTVIVMVVPFVRLYTRGVSDTNYFQPVFAVLITAADIIYCMRMPYQSVIAAAGHFKETKVCAYGEAIINIVLSVLLVSKYGLIGVAIGTIVAISFRLFYSVVYLSKHILMQPVSFFWKRIFIDSIIIVIICIPMYKLVSVFIIDNYLTWACYASFTVLIAFLITVIVNYIFYPEIIKRTGELVLHTVLRQRQLQKENKVKSV